MWLVGVVTALGGEGMDRLLEPTGWTTSTTVTSAERDDIVVQTKIVQGLTCVRGVVTVDVPAGTLLDVVADVPGHPAWSSERLLRSILLSPPGDVVDYWQYLDIPDWTLVSDRYWVARGETRRGPVQSSFRFERIPGWQNAYPALATQLSAEFPGAVEAAPMFGAWVFEARTPTSTLATYHLCSNAGSSMPQWVQTAAATRTMPGTVADVIRAARKRWLGR